MHIYFRQLIAVLIASHNNPINFDHGIDILIAVKIVNFLEERSLRRVIALLLLTAHYFYTYYFYYLIFVVN